MERYVDYSYYTQEFKGTVFESAADFDGAELRAQAFIDAITFGRAKPEQDGVKDAVCAAAESLYCAQKAGNISSESNDGYSVTFQRVSNTQAYSAAYRTAKLFLPPELLYRGVD